MQFLLLNSHWYRFKLSFLEYTFYTVMVILLNAVLNPILKIDTINKIVFMLFTYSLFPSVQK